LGKLNKNFKFVYQFSKRAKKNILNGIVMRKKYLAFLMIMVCWVSLCGFQKVEYGIILNDNTSVTEYVSVSYDAETLSNLATNQTDFNAEVQEIWDSQSGIKLYLESLFRGKVADLSLAEQTSYLSKVKLSFKHTLASTNQIVIAITYDNTTVWNYFCDNLDNIPVITYNQSFLTYDMIRTSSVKFSQFNISGQVKNSAELIYARLINLLVLEYGQSAVDSLNSPEYFYSYITSVSRVHSNATEPLVSLDGYYYHIWQFDNLESNEIIIYTTHANKLVWYMLALSATALFIGALLLIDKRKKSKKNTIENIL